MSVRSLRALDVLTRLNEARRIGQIDAVAELDAELEQIDQAGGFQRARGIHFGEPVPVDNAPGGPQRNPNWRAALDKLNAMRGRVG